MNDMRVTQGLREIADAQIPATVDLWPNLAAHLSARNDAPSHSVYTVRRRGGRRVLVGMCAAVLVLVVGLPLAVFAAQERISFFGVTLVDHRATVTAHPPGATPAADEVVTYCPPDCASGPTIVQARTVAEAQRHLPFPLRVPASLPAGFGQPGEFHVVLASATVPATVTMVFRTSSGGGTLSLDEIQGTQQGPYGIEAAQAQPVLVQGQPAVYAHGEWWKDPATGHIPRDRPSQWDADADAGILAWSAAGVTYVLRAQGVHLTRDEMIRIAASLH